MCFHSTDFPSEWGQAIQGRRSRDGKDKVSIQLISPASGDCAVGVLLSKEDRKSLFPFNLFPQRVGTKYLGKGYFAEEFLLEFPFNLFPQRVGTEIGFGLSVDSE